MTQLELQQWKNLSVKIPIKELKGSIIVPFYFSHNRYDTFAPLNFKQFKQDFSSSLAKLITHCNQFLSFGQFVLNEVKYQELYPHLDFKQTSHPISWEIIFQQTSERFLLFNGLRIDLYYDHKNDILSGGVTLESNVALGEENYYEALKYSYITHFLNNFLENTFAKKIVANYPQLFGVTLITQEKSDLNKTLLDLEQEWKKIVNENLLDDVNLYTSNLFFKDHLMFLFLVLNLVNLIKKPCLTWTSKAASILGFLITILNESEQEESNKRIAYIKTVRNNKDFFAKRYDFRNQSLNIANPMYSYSLIFDDEVDLNNSLPDNKILLFLNLIMNADTYLIGAKAKVQVTQREFLKLTEDLLENEAFCQELRLEINQAKFFDNHHYYVFNTKNVLLLAYSRQTLKDEAAKSLTDFYNISLVYYGAYQIAFTKLNNYASYVMNSEYTKRNVMYRRITYDLRTLNINFFYNFYGIDSMKFIVKQLDSQLHLLSKIQFLMSEVRKKDEIEKLIVERNSIATAFVCALFIGIIWFIDQCFASLQSMGTGVQGSYPGYPEVTIAYPIIYSFVALAVLIILISTVILLYQSLKLWVTYEKTKREGVLNVY